MDLLVLGAFAVVVVVLTLWIVWRPSPASDPRDSPGLPEEAIPMMPQGDEFEDQYTSATADLSAGGVAITTSSGDEGLPQPSVGLAPSPYQAAGEPWSEPTLAREGNDAEAFKPLTPAPNVPGARTISLGAAALLTVGGAAAGAWLYSRWQHRRNTPLKRLRRKIR